MDQFDHLMARLLEETSSHRWSQEGRIAYIQNRMIEKYAAEAKRLSDAYAQEWEAKYNRSGAVHRVNCQKANYVRSRHARPRT